MLPENVNWNAVLQSITDTWFPLEDHRFRNLVSCVVPTFISRQ